MSAHHPMDADSHQLMVIKINYGAADNTILDMKSVNLTPPMASKLVEAIAALVLGWPELDKLEQPENVRPK